MRLKRFLILAPTVLVVILLQSYFWVPTYEKQSVGNPDRLVTYIEGSLGDAKILNPILNADSASSSIVSQVFEGLLGLDENLNLRGRLATNWEVSEEAYLIVHPHRKFPDGSPVTGQRLLKRITSFLAHTQSAELTAVVRSVTLLPSESRNETVTVLLRDETGTPTTVEVAVAVTVPERIGFTLNLVDQDLFAQLEPVIGKKYTEDFPYDSFISWEGGVSPDVESSLRARFSELLPIQEHNPIIVFTLRKGVRFHDHHAFDAHDVKFTYESIMDPNNLSPRTPDFEPIQRVEILDPYSVRIVYKRLFSPAINVWTIGILPEHLLNHDVLDHEATARGLSKAAQANFGMRESRLNRHPIGTGPFRFIEWQTDEFIHLERNTDYWEGPPEYHHYYMRIIPDILTQEVEFQAGAIDYYGVLPHQVARYKKDPTYQSFSSLGFGYTYIGYNNRKPLFADPTVRRALGMAINVEEFIQYNLYGEGERTTGPFPQTTEWYDHSIEPLPYDPDGAVHILQELGWERNREGWLQKDGKPFEFNLLTNSGNPIRKNIMTIAQNAWKKIGIHCHTQYFEWAVFLNDVVNTGEFDALVLGWNMGIDPDLYQIWHSSQAGPQQLNFVGYHNPEADDLIIRIRREYDREKQIALTHRLHRVVYDDQPYTFLYAPLKTRVLDTKVVLVDRIPEGGERYRKIYPTKSGDLSFYFNKWRKLELTPDW